MNRLLIIFILLSAAFLSAQDHLVWIEAEPDTIFFDDNLTYSIVTVLVEDEDNNPVEGVWVYFDSDIGNLLHNIQTDENGIAETTFWESGDLGVATITAERNGEFLETQVTIIMPISADENEITPITDLRNYPNPFNPSTTISFQLNTEITENTELVIYNLKGQKVKTFSNLQITQSQNQQIVWNGTNDNGMQVSSGVYLYKVGAGNFELTRKMTLMK